MALISSESITLIVNGTLQSEFFTMFCPMRFTYSVTTGSLMNLVLFSISMAYILPILISVSVEYQFPIPRPPMSRLPTALTSSIDPAFTLTFWLPGSITLSGFTVVAGISPPTGVVPGAGFEGVLAGVSPPAGVVPGAGWAVGALAVGGPAVDVLDGVDCAHAIVASASANPASAAVLEAFQSVLMTSPPAPIHSRSSRPGGPSRFAPLFRRYFVPVWQQRKRNIRARGRFRPPSAAPAS